MTKDEAAALLTGIEYPARQIDKHASALCEAGLVAVFGMSDDLMEFRGSINDEADAYEGRRVMMDAKGIIPTFDAVNDEGDEDAMEEYFRRKPNGKAVEAIWSPPNSTASWMICTDIPHATFDIMEDGELYCRGVVFALADLA